jgi:DNA processing protein
VRGGQRTSLSYSRSRSPFSVAITPVATKIAYDRKSPFGFVRRAAKIVPSSSFRRITLTAAGAAEQDALQTRETCRLGWLALALTPEMGPTRSARAVAHLGSADRIFEAPLTELEAAGMPARSAQFCFDGRARTAAEQEIRRVLDSGGTCIALCDDEYPDRLRQIYDPPPVLWVRGSLDLLSQHGIAVVGTRHPSPYGSGMAEMLSRDLAGRGIVIQSGMARGIDTAAHKGALDAGGKTLAVWGTGIDVV